MGASQSVVLAKEAVMPYKDPEKHREKRREYQKRWYEKNKAKHIAGTQKNKRENRAQWNAYKASLSCTYCGAQHPAIIDFHHVIRDKDKRAVNHLAKNAQFTAALEEVKKCIPLCANCHRILHWNEAQEKKAQRRLKKENKKLKGMEPKK
jgi:predicted HNH restriction endonuclease